MRDKIVLIAMMLSLFHAINLYASDCPKKRDLNNDCKVDFQDLQILAEYWLNNSCDNSPCSDADLTEDGIVNLADFENFASKDWMDVGVPIEINEILAHSHDTMSDWIELYNPNDYDVNIGGWYLSDNNSNEIVLKKYRIADNTIIKAGQYKVFYESNDFGNPKDKGCIVPFALSERGEAVYLCSAVDDILTGYTEKVSFTGSDSGISFGRFYNSAYDNYDFVSLKRTTPGSANADAKINALVINEIMYHAAAPGSGDISDDDNDYDYIELYNTSDSGINLYTQSEDQTTGWTITDAIELSIPGTIRVPKHGFVVLVKDLTAFNERYTNVPSSAIVMEWDSGKLSNSSENICLSMPGDYELDNGGWYYIVQDKVEYFDNSPWPGSADGDGDSLCRIHNGSSALYGNSANSWYAGTPTPGAENAAQ